MMPRVDAQKKALAKIRIVEEDTLVIVRSDGKFRPPVILFRQSFTNVSYQIRDTLARQSLVNVPNCNAH